MKLPAPPAQHFNKWKTINFISFFFSLSGNEWRRKAAVLHMTFFARFYQLSMLAKNSEYRYEWKTHGKYKITIPNALFRRLFIFILSAEISFFSPLSTYLLLSDYFSIKCKSLTGVFVFMRCYNSCVKLSYCESPFSTWLMFGEWMSNISQ